MFSFNFKYVIGIVAVLLMVSTAVSAEIEVGEATVYSGKNLRRGNEGVCDLPKQWEGRQAIINQEDFDKIEDPCNKCIIIKGVATAQNSRRFTRGVYAKIADTCTSNDCDQGSLRLSSSVMKAISSGAQADSPVVNWEVVECPRSSNLRGRKLI